MNLELNLIEDKRGFLEFIKKEIVLIIAITLAIGTLFISLPKLEYIDFKVIILLFNLMIVVAEFKELQLLDSIATSLLKICTSFKAIICTLAFLTFFSAMIVTNDVSLITFVDFFIFIGNISSMSVIKNFMVNILSSEKSTFISSIISSQFII